MRQARGRTLREQRRGPSNGSKRKAGASQDSCRLIHATNRVLFSARTWSRMTASRSGFSVTAPIGDQLRVFFDQRAGLPSRAWR